MHAALWARAGALAGALLVPLALALASQSLAARPGDAPVPEVPVVLPGEGPAAPVPQTPQRDV